MPKTLALGVLTDGSIKKRDPAFTTKAAQRASEPTVYKPRGVIKRPGTSDPPEGSHTISTYAGRAPGGRAPCVTRGEGGSPPNAGVFYAHQAVKVKEKRGLYLRNRQTRPTRAGLRFSAGRNCSLLQMGVPRGSVSGRFCP